VGAPWPTGPGQLGKSVENGIATALRPCHKNMAGQYAISNKDRTFDINQSGID
jgi:hypothetical protein